MKINKKGEIEELNKQLNFPKELSGVFLPYKYKEKFNFMFLGEMPSQNEPRETTINNQNFNFNITKRDKLLQSIMIKCSIAGSYITDIVKSRDAARMPFKQEVEKYRNFLLDEIEIIDPNIIIIIGKRTYEQSFLKYIKPFINEKIICDYVFHYSSQVPREKFKGKFKQVIKKYQDNYL